MSLSLSALANLKMSRCTTITYYGTSDSLEFPRLGEQDKDKYIEITKQFCNDIKGI